jgi:TetR/AcrR family transcriptional repressor of nem operon
MKVSAEKKAQNRAAILAVAGRLLREKGPDGLGVAEVMAGAGMTHGGFYGHFASREDLAAEALAQALRQTTEFMAQAIAEGGFEAFAKGYLSEGHLDAVAEGCPIAATASDIARQSEALQAAFAAGLRTYLDVGAAGQERAAALARLSGMIGALTLARAVASVDRPLARELLAAAEDVQVQG